MFQKIKNLVFGNKGETHVCEVEPLPAEEVQKYKHLGSWEMEQKCKHCQKSITKTYIV